MSYLYLTAPYFNENNAIRNENYTKISYYYTSLLLKKQFPYSPAICHHSLINDFSLESYATSWMAHCFAMLASAKELHVLTLPNWADNIAVLAEINFWRASRQGSPIYYIDGSIVEMGRRSKKLTGNSNQCAPALKAG